MTWTLMLDPPFIACCTCTLNKLALWSDALQIENNNVIKWASHHYENSCIGNGY